MLIKEFFAVLGIALAGASLIVLAIHFGLKIFKPEAFENTKRPTLGRVMMRPVEQISQYVSDAMGAYFSQNVESRNNVARQRAQETFGSVLAPHGQPRSSDSMAIPRAGAEHQVSGAGNAAQLGASS
jgi:hypothetical protein